jgi:integrase
MRGHGEGTIFRRASTGKWTAMLTLPNGRRRTMTGDSRQEVQRKLAQARRELEQGATATTDRQTVAQFLTQWIATKRHDLAPKTYVTWEMFVRLHFTPAFRRTPLVKLSPQQVQKAEAEWRDTGLSSTTVAHLHSVLHNAMGEAVRLGLIARNPLDAIKRPKARKLEMRVLTEAQAQLLMAAARSERLGALIALALSTGMRQGELLGLRWRDVDLEAGRVTVHVILQPIKGDDGITRPLLKEPKTPHSKRSIALTPSMVAELRAHRQRQRLERIALGPGVERSGSGLLQRGRPALRQQEHQLPAPPPPAAPARAARPARHPLP